MEMSEFYDSPLFYLRRMMPSELWHNRGRLLTLSFVEANQNITAYHSSFAKSKGTQMNNISVPFLRSHCGNIPDSFCVNIMYIHHDWTFLPSQNSWDRDRLNMGRKFLIGYFTWATGACFSRPKLYRIYLGLWVSLRHTPQTTTTDNGSQAVKLKCSQSVRPKKQPKAEMIVEDSVVSWRHD
jgi:hypothetical protein